MAELKFGVVGLGIASTQILPAFAELEGVSVTAASDLR
jgi:predicted dehydrogenase